MTTMGSQRVRGVLAGLLVAVAPLVGAQPAPPLSTAYDGAWWIALSCADTTDRNGPVRGYDYHFAGQIQDGHLDARYGTDGLPASVHYVGEVRDGGVLEIRANGITGANEYSVGRVARGTPYAYTMGGQLDDRQGRATRREVRPCTAVFTRR